MRSWLIGSLALVLVGSIEGCGGAPSPQPPPEVSVPTPPTVQGSADTSAPIGSSAPIAKPKPPVRGPKIAALPDSPIRFEGGDGSSQDHPIKILGAKGEQDGVASEYEYLTLVYGKGTWKSDSQSLLDVNGKKIDQLDITHSGGQKETVYFDITDYFGKF